MTVGTTHWAEQDGAGEIFFHTLSARKATAALPDRPMAQMGRLKSRIIVTSVGQRIDSSKPWPHSEYRSVTTSTPAKRRVRALPRSTLPMVGGVARPTPFWIR